jgi:peptidoglycan/xylan/chitin deacetylase (PgdA/CDA1 family)
MALARVLYRLAEMAGIVLYGVGAARFIIRLRRRTPRVVLYHACQIHETDFIRGMGSNTSPGVFAAHLDFYVRHYRVVPVAQLEESSYPDRAIAITFDDGYRSCLEHAFPLLQNRGLPATVYLIAGIVGTGEIVWVNELTWYVNRYPDVARPLVSAHFGLAPTASVSQILIAACGAYDRGSITHLLNEIRQRTDGGAMKVEGAGLYLSWGDVRLMHEHGLTFGNHTETHPILPELTADEQRKEILAAQELLTSHLPEVTSFAYPSGEKDETVEATTRALGFKSVMEVGGTNHPFDSGAVARVPVDGLSAAKVFARVEVVEPLKGVVRRMLNLGRR